MRQMRLAAATWPRGPSRAGTEAVRGVRAIRIWPPRVGEHRGPRLAPDIALAGHGSPGLVSSM